MESNLRNALVAAKTYFVDGDTYAGWSPTVARQLEPPLRWITGPPVASSDVSIVPVAGKRSAASRVLMVSRSDSGTYFCIYDDASTGTSYGEGPTFSAVDTPAGCSSPQWGP